MRLIYYYIYNMNNNIVYILFIFVCLILRYIYVSFLANKINISSYFPLFGLLYVTTYYLTKKVNLALFTSFVTIIGRTLYRYHSTDLDYINKISIENSILFIIGISLPFIVNYYKKYFKSYYIDGFNFIALVYAMLSCVEYILHKNIMHCDRDSAIVKMIKKIPLIGNEFFVTCNHHIEHHLDVEKDMHIDVPSSEAGLYMNWIISAYLIPITIVVMVISRYISKFNISNRMIFVLSCIFSFIWQYIWNKVHVEMHNLENKYSIKKGPYDEGLFDLNPVTRALFTNHANHHIQKGEKKGNFNVIIMGADEWFNSNNKNPDNSEYCKTHKDDKMCH